MVPGCERDASIIQSGNALSADNGLKGMGDVVPDRDRCIRNLDGIGMDAAAFRQNGSDPTSGLALQGCRPSRHFDVKNEFYAFLPR